MKAIAAKEKRPASTSHRRHSSLHSPLAAKIRLQRENIHRIVQPKLSIGEPADRYEQEADRVADSIVSNRPVPVISSISGPLSSTGAPQKSSGSKKTQTSSNEPGQAPEDEIQLRPDDIEEEPLQAGYLQRLPENEEDEPVQAKGAILSTGAASNVVRHPSPGTPIRPDIREVLESGTGADLSSVRVHEDSSAHEAAASIQAKAFTHKNNIWLGAGQSQSDLHLMAHEITHVVQQGAAAANGSITAAGDGGRRVQRLWNPVAAAANLVRDAAELVGDSIGDVVDYIKGKAGELVRRMPGYSLFTVVVGSDPFSGEHVDRTGLNFIEASLDVVPNGRALRQKLVDVGALSEAAGWLDEQIAELDINPSEIGRQLSALFAGLGIDDIRRLPSVMRRVLNIIQGPVNRVIRFAGNVAGKLLEIVKDYLVSSLINFIKNRTRAYPLLRVILQRDPLSGEAVERTPMALLRGFMQLSESGAEQLRQMEESGSLQRAADWLDGAVARLHLSWEMIAEGFRSIWRSAGIESLLEPAGIFRKIYETFAAPVMRIVRFVNEVGRKVLQFIKDALIGRLAAYARTISGYPLLTVILGRDPFSDEPVERSPEKIIHGFMGLMEGGEEQFQEMKQTGVIARLAVRIERAVATLNFTWEYIKGLFVRAWERLSLSDLAAPIAAFIGLMKIFAEPLGRLVRFVSEVIRIVIEVALKLMNFPVTLISNIVSRAMQAFEDIKRDPMGFLKNLMRAVKSGFSKFFDNILTHLREGLTGWLFKELERAGISPPADLGFKSILGFVLDVLGLTADKILEKIAARIGRDKADRIRGMIGRLRGIWSFVSDVVTQGPVAIWKYIQEKISGLWNVVLEAVRNWVVTRIIRQITAKLLSMLDPTGIMAVVNGFIAFYKAIQSFIDYLREMLEIVNSFVQGVAEIARGSVVRAASFLEGALARGVPVVIGFLANQVGLSGLGRRIGEMVERVRALVDRALAWLIDKAVSAGGVLLNLGRRGVAAIRGWWSTRRKVTTEDGEEHRLEFAGSGASTQLVIRSEPVKYSEYIRKLKRKIILTPADKKKVQAAEDKAQEIDKLVDEGKRLFRSNASDRNKSNLKRKMDREMENLADLTKRLPLKDSADAYAPTEYGPRRRGYGTRASVAFMKKGRPGGSEADSSLFTDNYRDLNLRRRGNGSFYVRGHLLSWHLGGPGNDWRNLTPLFQGTNGDHYTKFESHVISNYNKRGYAIKDFEVRAVYGRVERRVPVKNVKVNDDQPRPFSSISEAARNKVRKILKAETAVPTELVCKAAIRDTRGNEIPINPVSIPNKIDDKIIEVKDP